MSVNYKTSILAGMNITELLICEVQNIEVPAVFDPISGKILIKARTIKQEHYRLGLKTYSSFYEMSEDAEEADLVLFTDGNKVIIGLEILKFMVDSELDAYELDDEIILSFRAKAEVALKLFGIESPKIKIIAVSKVD